MNQMKTAPHGLVSARKKYIANRESLHWANIDHTKKSNLLLKVVSKLK